MAKYDYLDEMRIHFANPRLKEFIANNCLPEQSGLDLNIDDDKRVGFANYIFCKSLASSHKTLMQVEARLKANKIMGETFAVHHDTFMLQMMTWIRFSNDSRSVDRIVAGENSEEDNPTGISRCLAFTSAMSQLLMTELMGSGDDSGSFSKVDSLIKMKVDTAYEKNQTLLINASRGEKDPKPTMAYIILSTLLKNSEDSLRFALDKWELTAAERKQFTKKLDTPLKEEDDKMIALILFQTIKALEPELDHLYKDAYKLHSQIFKK